MKRDLGFNKLRIFNKIFGIDIAKASAAYTVERDLIDSINIPTKIVKRAHHKDALLTFLSSEEPLKPEIIEIRRWKNILQFKFNLCLNHCYEIIQFDNGSSIDTKDGRLEINKDLYFIINRDSISLYNGSRQIRSDKIEISEEGIRINSSIRTESAIFGTGERALNLNLKGHKVNLWNKDADGAYSKGKDPLYINVPFYIDYTKDFFYGILYNNSSKGFIDFGMDKVYHEFSEGSCDFFFIFGDSMESLISQFQELIGKPYLPPKWAFGFHQSRYSYKSTSEVEAVFDGFKKNDIPVSAIHLDIDYMKGYRVFTLNENFSDLIKLSDKMQKEGSHLVAILDPGVKYESGYPLFDEGLKNGYFVKDPHGNIIKGPVWPGFSSFPDFTDPNVRDWWASHYSFFKENGIEGVWHDMNEPALFVLWGDNTLPQNAVHSIGFHRSVHNLYAYFMAKAGYEGLKRNISKRHFLLSRSGWLGINSYSFVWTGDITSTWKSLKITIPMLLNMSLSGIGLAGSDVGGFSGSPSKELYLRWLALGALSPFFRVHSSNYSKRREPWMFDDETLEAAKKIIKFRYTIIPYIFSLAYEYSKEGIPLMRPRFWYEPDNLDETSFYLGKSLLAFPILKPTTSKIKIKLPKGEWFDLYKEEIVSGILERDASYDYIPVFQKHGSIVPMNPENLIFNFLPGENCSFVYYDENEENPDEWIKINFICEKNGNGVKISWKYEGSYLEKYKTLKFRVRTTHVISIYQEDISRGFLNIEIEI
ncbi:MAG: glycoside hydrolase family 31 protein [Thermoplasmatales archaeon]